MTVTIKPSLTYCDRTNKMQKRGADFPLFYSLPLCLSGTVLGEAQADAVHMEEIISRPKNLNGRLLNVYDLVGQVRGRKYFSTSTPFSF